MGKERQALRDVYPGPFSAADVEAGRLSSYRLLEKMVMQKVKEAEDAQCRAGSMGGKVKGLLHKQLKRAHRTFGLDKKGARLVYNFKFVMA